jgi:hypothetical protein
VKNSLRAVNDRFEDADVEPPPVRVVVAEGDEDVTIKARPPLSLISCSILPNCLVPHFPGASAVHADRPSA